MAPHDLRESLSDLIARRKLAGGEFSYVYIPSDEEVLGKKAVFKLLQNDETVFESFKNVCNLSGETDLAFNSKVLKLITSLPFEDEKETPDIPAPKKASPTVTKKVSELSTPRIPVRAPSPEKEKTPVVKTILQSPGPKKELMSKMSLSKLVARRRLEGGEFSYVYIPLEKAISGKKAVYNFLKNQTEEFNKLKKSCKEADESDDEFDSRMLKQILTVPYEKEIIETPSADEPDASEVGAKRKFDNSTNGENKKPKTDPIGSTRNVFVEVEIFKSNQVSAHLTQIGAIEDRPTNPRKWPLCSKKLLILNDNVLEKLNMAILPCVCNTIIYSCLCGSLQAAL